MQRIKLQAGEVATVQPGSREVGKTSLWSPSDLLYKLNCGVDKQLAERDLFFAGLWIAGKTAVEVSKSCHNSTIKLQNSLISFQDNTACIASFRP